MKALLVIDMQQGSFTTATPRHDADGIVKRINLLADQLRQHHNAVIFIQHDGTVQDNFKPGSEEWLLLRGLEQKPQDHYIAKTANDCFYRSELAPLLNELDVQELIITGCATDFCVDTTIKAALSRDYNITVIADAHTTADRLQLRAAKVIEYYNWLWQDMLPTMGSLRVMNCADYCQHLTAV